MKKLLFALFKYCIQGALILTVWHFCLDIPIKNIWVVFVVYAVADFIVSNVHRGLVGEEKKDIIGEIRWRFKNETEDTEPTLTTNKNSVN